MIQQISPEIFRRFLQLFGVEIILSLDTFVDLVGHYVLKENFYSFEVLHF